VLRAKFPTQREILSGGMSFNLAKLRANIDTDACVKLAITAQKAEMFSDMVFIVKELGNLAVREKRDLTSNERSLIATAFKNIVGQQRASRRVVWCENREDVSVAYKQHIQDEMTSFCNDSISFFSSMKRHQTSMESSVFFTKMLADFYRYLAEISMEENLPDFEEKRANALELYSQAKALSEGKLHKAHPLWLGVALNVAVCYYELMKDRKQACKVAKNAFNEAIFRLDSLDELFYKDSTLLMQLIRDNLTAWTAEQ